MFHEGLLDRTLRQIKKLIPKNLFDFLAPYYHAGLAHAGAFLYGFPSRSLTVIGVTGTKGKSTTVFLITKILEGAGKSVAAIGSLGYKIKDNEWPNTLKMTMPGRFKLQRFLKQAKDAGCRYVVLEVTSEGIKQKRHLGIQFDCAVFTNLHKEHLESHGSFENYMAAKQELFRETKNIHVINADDPYADQFGTFPAKRKIFYGTRAGDMVAHSVEASGTTARFTLFDTPFQIHFGGMFNVYNTLAALATSAMYGIDVPTAQPILEKIKFIPGRMEYVQRSPFAIVVDYAHTPDSLEAVYNTLQKETKGKLICVLGAAGGGRDTWKRKEFGKIATNYCDEIILTNEDPYDESPEKIISEIRHGISAAKHVTKILDRKEAIGQALQHAQHDDTIVITGKGSETSIAYARGKKIPWSDREVVREFLKQ